MNLTTVIRSKWFWLFALSILVIAFISMASQKPSIEALDLEQRNGNWETASFKYKRVSAAEISKLNVEALWGLESADQVAPPDDNGWALKGIIDDNGIRVAIIDLNIESTGNQGERFGRFKEGDTLPNGSALITIARRHIEYKLNGNIETKRLYE